MSERLTDEQMAGLLRWAADMNLGTLAHDIEAAVSEICEARAEIARLTAALAEASTKGERLCEDHGNLLVRYHDLERELADARTAARGQTHYCKGCAGLAKERDDARAELDALQAAVAEIVESYALSDEAEAALGILLSAHYRPVRVVEVDSVLPVGMTAPGVTQETFDVVCDAVMQTVEYHARTVYLPEKKEASE